MFSWRQSIAFLKGLSALSEQLLLDCPCLLQCEPTLTQHQDAQRYIHKQSITRLSPSGHPSPAKVA